MPNRLFNAAPLDHTQVLADYGIQDVAVKQIVTLAAPGTVEVFLRRGTESQAAFRLDLVDLDTVIALLRTARKTVKQ